MKQELADWCRRRGIVPFASSSYTPSQNEAENIVKIISQGVEALQMQFGGPNKHYVRALDHLTIVDELLPHNRPLGDYHTPFEAFLQTPIPWKQLINGIYPYGCKAYLHVPNSLRAHTYGCPKAILCYHLGLSKRKKGYVVLTHKHRKVIDGVW